MLNKIFLLCLIIVSGIFIFSACEEEEKAVTREYILLGVDTAGITESSVILKWTRSNSVSFDHYQIHRSKVRGFTTSSSTFIKDIYNQNTTRDTVFPLLAGTTYFFKLKLFTKDGNATESNEASAKTL